MLQATSFYLTHKSNVADSLFPARTFTPLDLHLRISAGVLACNHVLGVSNFSVLPFKAPPRALTNRSDTLPFSNLPSENIINTIKQQLAGNEDSFMYEFLAYDMGYVARIAEGNGGFGPQFPRSLDWIVDNQCSDGSWDGAEDHSQRICSTLSCLIALKAWKRAESNIQKGLRYFASQLPLVHDKLNEGTVIILSKLIENAKELDLELDYADYHIQLIRGRGQILLLGVSNDALEQYPTSFVHILEAFDDRPNWRVLLKYQSISGCLFSTALTACAYMHTSDKQCLRYLENLLKNASEIKSAEHGNILQRVQVVEWLLNLGIERFFKREIQQVLAQAFRYWRGNAASNGNQRHLKSSKDCALLFKALRRQGYNVSPDTLHRLNDDDSKLTCSASQFYFHAERERMPLSCGLNKETDALPWYAIMDRIEHITKVSDKSIEKFEELWSTSLCAEVVAFAKSDFNSCQRIYQQDVKTVTRWWDKCQFGRLETYARRKDVFSFFVAAATMFEPELSMARILWAKTSVLAIVIDDFMDTHSSLEDLRTFCAAVRRWDTSGLELHEDAKILLHGLFNTVDWATQAAFPLQGTDISHVLQAQWVRLCDAYLSEAECRLTNQCPGLHEYLENGSRTIALEPIMLSVIFFMGEKVDLSVLDHPDCINMYWRASTIGRLLNDIQGLERESREGEFSWIPIYMKEHPGASVDDAVAEMRKIIEKNREELVEDILQPRGVPKKCKRVFESMMKVLYSVYHLDDGLTSDQLKDRINQVLYKKLD